MVPPETISSGLLVAHQRYSHLQIKLSYVLNVGQGALKIPCEVLTSSFVFISCTHATKWRGKRSYPWCHTILIINI